MAHSVSTSDMALRKVTRIDSVECVENLVETVSSSDSFGYLVSSISQAAATQPRTQG